MAAYYPPPPCYDGEYVAQLNGIIACLFKEGDALRSRIAVMEAEVARQREENDYLSKKYEDVLASRIKEANEARSEIEFLRETVDALRAESERFANGGTNWERAWQALAVAVLYDDDGDDS